MKPFFSRFFISPEAGEHVASTFRGVISDATTKPVVASSASLLPQALPIQLGSVAAACSVTANRYSHSDLALPIRSLLSPKVVLLAKRSMPAYPLMHEQAPILLANQTSTWFQ